MDSGRIVCAFCGIELQHAARPGLTSHGTCPACVPRLTGAPDMHEATTLRDCYQCGRTFEIYPSAIARAQDERGQLLCSAACVAEYEREAEVRNDVIADETGARVDANDGNDDANDPDEAS